MVVYYSAVEDDPLDSGINGYVIASGPAANIKGEDGRYRKMAFIGDSAWCAACKSTGVIVGGAPVRPGGRMVDRAHGGRLQAVGGDEVACKCTSRPRIIAVHGRRWRIQDDTSTTAAANRITPGSIKGNGAPSSPFPHDEQFTLRASSGDVLPDTYYTIRLHSGAFEHGVTDSMGRTKRHTTNGAQKLTIYLGHKVSHDA